MQYGLWLRAALKLIGFLQFGGKPLSARISSEILKKIL